jgi:hypothetical protein
MTGGTAIKLADERANTGVVGSPHADLCGEIPAEQRRESEPGSPAKDLFALGTKVITCKKAAGRRSRGLPPPTTTWPGRAQRSWSKTKLQPNELNRRTSTAALSRHSLGSPAHWPEQRRTPKSHNTDVACR